MLRELVSLLPYLSTFHTSVHFHGLQSFALRSFYPVMPSFISMTMKIKKRTRTLLLQTSRQLQSCDVYLEVKIIRTSVDFVIVLLFQPH